MLSTQSPKQIGLISAKTISLQKRLTILVSHLFKRMFWETLFDFVGPEGPRQPKSSNQVL